MITPRRVTQQLLDCRAMDLLILIIKLRFYYGQVHSHAVLPLERANASGLSSPNSRQTWYWTYVLTGKLRIVK
jgi:hypothetical protein